MSHGGGAGAAGGFLLVIALLILLYTGFRYGWKALTNTPEVVWTELRAFSKWFLAGAYSAVFREAPHFFTVELPKWIGVELPNFVLHRFWPDLVGAVPRIGYYFRPQNFPIGILIVALFLVFAIRVGIEKIGSDSEASTIQAIKPVDLADPRAVYEPLEPEAGADAHAAPDLGPVVPPPPDTITIWTVRGRTTLPNELPPPPISRPPQKSRFPIQMLATFVVVVIVLILTRSVWLNLYDQFVHFVASVLYYPYAPPAHLSVGSHVLPDFILLMYLSAMISWGLASGLFWSGKFSSRQRWGALGILLTYLFVEALLDSVGFNVTNSFAASGFLVARGVTGGFFSFVLLFDSFILPQPMQITPRFARDRGTIRLFIATAVPSLLVAAGLLYGLWGYLGRLGVSLPFAVLLLLPLITLVIFNLLGRVFYEVELRRRRVPSVQDYHPPVTVIIPAFNEEERIAQAIRSADRAARLYPGFTEVVVGNDGSTDHTSAIARAEIAQMHHATGVVVDLPHGGKSNALNGVLRLARGELMIRVDADCRLSEDFGFTAIVPHFADPEIGAVQGMLLPLQREGWVRKMRIQEICWNHLFLRRGLMATRSTQVVDGAFSSFRRKDMLEVGGWVPWNGEDNEITLRLYRLGYRTRFEPKALVFEDVPEDYAALRKQRIRWNRGGLFAHRRHLPALTSPAFEFGGLATVIWALTFLKSGMRYMIYVYAALITLLTGIPTLITVAFVVAFLLIPRGAAICYYLVRLGYWRDVLWVPTWPLTSAIKQSFAVESFGTMTPGNPVEFSE
ncbi:MAG: glycosyltransferase [Thermoplasmata archaeon]